ncbi:MAG: type III pantothenate kinase [Treponema sp.]|nr:type III pantothenate kinase [Treponema sp.]
MLFTVDIGNTNTVVSVFRGDEVLSSWRVATDAKRTSDEYVSQLIVLSENEKLNLNTCKRAIISSVVPSLTETFVNAVEKLCGIKPYVMTSAVMKRGLLPIGMNSTSASEIGSDLICDAMGAWNLYHSANIVVDFGTALTFTVTDSSGTIQGVSIAPGLMTAMRSLFLNTAQLPQVPLESPASSLGTNTIESIQSGVVLGYKGLVEYLVSEMKKDLCQITGDEAENVKVIATGGLNSVLSQISTVFDDVDKDLTLKGLKVIADRIIPSE